MSKRRVPTWRRSSLDAWVQYFLPTYSPTSLLMRAYIQSKNKIKSSVISSHRPSGLEKLSRFIQSSRARSRFRIRTTDSLARAAVSFAVSFWKEKRDGPSDRGFWSKSKSRACKSQKRNERTRQSVVGCWFRCGKISSASSHYLPIESSSKRFAKKQRFERGYG